MKNFKEFKLPINLKVIFPLFLVSAITGVFIGLFLGALSWSFGIYWPNWMRIALISGSLFSALTWVVILRYFFKDFNKGKDHRVTHTIIWKEHEQDKQLKLSTITTATNEQLREMAHQVHKMKGRINSPLLTRIFGSRERGDKFRDEMILLGYMKWKSEEDHKQGIVVTKKGLALLKAYLPHPKRGD